MSRRRFFFITEEGMGGGDVAPIISNPGITVGTGHVGSILSVTGFTVIGTPDPTLAFQWKRDGASIGGATSSTYTPIEADENTIITRETEADNGESPAAIADSVGISVFTSRVEANRSRAANQRSRNY